MTALALSNRTEDRLNTEDVVWLTTVGSGGGPASTPVWFLWSGNEFLVLSRPDAAKVPRIAANDRVALNLNSSRGGGDVVAFTGRARIDPSGPADAEWSAFSEKYADGFVAVKTTPQAFLDDYSTLIRIAPERLRQW